MRRPHMILFDYAQTLADQAPFDGIRGTEAVLAYSDPAWLHHTAANQAPPQPELFGQPPE